MNSFDEGGHRHEIIIVKRAHSDEDEGHHGGVWKIAFADFMTAMMCFFLVMWLINAANEETRAALASYFNPVNLVDRNSSTKGLQEPDGPQPIEVSPEEKNEESEPSPSAPAKADSPSSEQNGDKARSDEQLFSNPYAVLAEIAADAGTMQNVSSKGDGGAQTSGPATGASGGESYRDPFAPDFWSRQVEGPETTIPVEDAERAKAAEPTAQKPEAVAAAVEGKKAEPQADGTVPKASGAAPATAGAAPPPLPDSAKESSPPSTADGKPPEEKLKETQAPQDAPIAEATGQRKPAPEKLKAAEAIRLEVAKALGANEKLSEGISVSAIDRGVVISITDQLNFGMFEIGSAVPRREMVLAMEKIGKILSERDGKVAISGHTDGRPFRGETYDNWRLSTARAHSAYYMLVRGGLDEQRIVEVAGFADRKLKVANDPLAAMNRRIEILLEVGG